MGNGGLKIMQCNQVQDILLTDYSDREIAPWKKQEIDRHLAQCSGCRELYEQIQGLRIELKKDRSDFPPSRVWERIRARIEGQRLAVPERIPWFQRLFERIRLPAPVLYPVFASFAVILLLAGTVYFHSSHRPSLRPGSGVSLFQLAALATDAQDDEKNFLMDVEKYFL